MTFEDLGGHHFRGWCCRRRRDGIAWHSIAGWRYLYWVWGDESRYQDPLGCIYIYIHRGTFYHDMEWIQGWGITNLIFAPKIISMTTRFLVSFQSHHHTHPRREHSSVAHLRTTSGFIAASFRPPQCRLPHWSPGTPSAPLTSVPRRPDFRYRALTSGRGCFDPSSRFGAR